MCEWDALPKQPAAAAAADNTLLHFAGAPHCRHTHTWPNRNLVAHVPGIEVDQLRASEEGREQWGSCELS